MVNRSDDFLALLEQNDFSNRDVSFLFSEIRKIIESGDIEYKTLKFYCDWLLHPKKDYFHSEMKTYIKEIYDYSVKHIKSPMMYEYSKKVNELIYFSHLKEDLRRVLNDKNLSKKILDEETWLNLIRVLVKLLENQPLISPIDEVEWIDFTPAAEGAAIICILFSKPVFDRNRNPQYHYKIGNFY